MAATKSRERHRILYLAVPPNMASNPHLAEFSQPQQPTLMVIKVARMMNYDNSKDPEISPPKQHKSWLLVRWPAPVTTFWKPFQRVSNNISAPFYFISNGFSQQQKKTRILFSYPPPNIVLWLGDLGHHNSTVQHMVWIYKCQRAAQAQEKSKLASCCENSNSICFDVATTADLNKWCQQCKMAALISMIFWLKFCPVGDGGEASSIFIQRLQPTTLEWRNQETSLNKKRTFLKLITSYTIWNETYGAIIGAKQYANVSGVV